MMMRSSFLLAFASVIAVVLSQSFSASSFAASASQFQLNNAAIMASDGLQLTYAQFSEAGSAFLKNTTSLDNGASFSTAFSFSMAGGYGNDGSGNGADGIVFCINSVSNTAGTIGGGIGYQGIPRSVGIEFDSWNNGYPIDINGNHVGIDLDGNVESAASVNYPTLFNDGNIHYAWVDFNGATQVMEVRVADQNNKPAAALLTYTVDLISHLGTPEVYVGFTASTGGSEERHLVTSWSFANTYNPTIVVPPSTPTPVSVCGNGIVEAGEDCDGGVCCSSTCSFDTAGSVCRASNGPCDVAEVCSGSSASCPSDSFAAQSTVCRASIGPCDPAETCTGSSAACPADVSGHVETACSGLEMTVGNTFSALNYDVISFGAFVASTGDIAGRGLVRRSAQVGSGWSVGYYTHTLSTDQTETYAMIVGGNMTFESGAVYPDGSTADQKETLFVGGGFNGPSYLGEDVTGTCTTPQCLDSQFYALRNCYVGYQTALQQADNVQHTVQWSGLNLQCNSATDSTYYLTLTPSEMESYTYVNSNGCSNTARWIINVAGTDNVVFTGGSFPAANGAVTYNILGSGRTINVHDTNLNANLFAPLNTLSQVSGVINGRVVVGDVTSSLQMNKAQCYFPQ